MEVILTKDVDTLGQSGDIKDVSDGFARNYLLPRKFAVIATDGARKDLARRIERIRAKAEKKHQDDLQKMQAIEAVGLLTLEANAGETGKLFGTITTKELARVLNEKTGLSLERKQLNVDKPINQVGEYTLYAKVSAKVTATVGIRVLASKTAEPASILPEEDDSL